MSLNKLYQNWRRKTFPSTLNDLEWRHNELRARLELIQDVVSATQFQQQKFDPELQAKLIDFFHLLEPKKVDGFDKIRVGSNYDGGYVQLNDFNRIKFGFSLGISDDDNWDADIASQGIEVHQFDHTIDAPPTIHKNLHFHRKQISTYSSPLTTSLTELLQPRISDEYPSVILKIDIEGDEWKVFDATSAEELNVCSQVLCEFHNFSQLNNSGFYSLAYRVLEKLADTFSVIHIHANNCAPVYNIANIMVPEVLEVTFANKNLYKFSESKEIFPTSLDAPCSKDTPDIFLGAFKFKQ